MSPLPHLEGRRRVRARSRFYERLSAVLALVAAVLLILLVLEGLRVALAVEPTTCAFKLASPTLDSFQSVAPESKWNAADHNRLLCSTNALERRSKQAGAPETVCGSTTVAAATRQLVSLGLGAPVTGNEPVLGPSVRDGTNPARLEGDGVQGLSGTAVSVWVFNRDGTNARTGTVCVSVVRP